MPRTHILSSVLSPSTRPTSSSRPQDGKLCATPFGVDVVGITELIALIGALVGGVTARRRKEEVERLNEQLRSINLNLRQQARAGTVYAPGRGGVWVRARAGVRGKGEGEGKGAADGAPAGAASCATNGGGQGRACTWQGDGGTGFCGVGARHRTR